MSALKQKPEIFSFLIGVSGIDTEKTDYEDLLFEAGCSDAVVFIENGNLFVEFDRECESRERAIETAKENIAKAGGSIIFVENIRN